ncbi:MAG: hypothetical protein R6U96_05310 [Promethearchaeia archaeon]
MEKSKSTKIILILLWLAALIASINSAFSQGSKAESIVPISGLKLQNHLLLFNVVIPNVLTLIFILLFPLIFVPLFLFVKNKIWFQYENTYIDLSEEDGMDLKKLAKRLIYVFLLTMGLSATFLNMGLIHPEDFLAEEQRVFWINQIGIDKPLYIADIFQTIAYLALPVAVGLWSIGWALEDCGLMHYKLPESKEKMLYEIEPVYRKYQSIIKGYAGISAILYFVSAISYYIINQVGGLGGILQIIGGSFILVFIMVPGYFLYQILVNKILKKVTWKKMEEIRIITKNEIQKE